MSIKIIDRIDKSEYFSLKKNYSSFKEVESSFRRSEVGVVIVFDENFSENLLHLNNAEIQVIADASDPNSAKTLVNYVSNIIAQSLKDLNKAPQSNYQITPELKTALQSFNEKFL